MSEILEIHFNCILEPSEESSKGYYVRYLQVGYEDKNGFTGLITDYCEKGLYEGFYMLEGEVTDEDELDEDYDGDEEAFIDDAVPGLVSLVNSKVEELVTFEERGEKVVCLPTEDLLKVKSDNYKEGEIVSDVKNLAPVNGYNTTF